MGDADRDASAAGGSETQQNHATSGWRAMGVSMLTSPPAAVLVTQVRFRQTKSLGPRLETMTMRGPIAALPPRRLTSALVSSVPAWEAGLVGRATPAGHAGESW